MQTVAIIGLGYVGLPLAVTIGKTYNTIGFDINKRRIQELRNGVDRTQEVSKQEITQAINLTYTADSQQLEEADWFIVTVPTPIDDHKKPDLTPLVSATRTVGKSLSKGNVVIYESTVYPGCTEEVCVPILEQESGLKYNVDFYCGYSPERINPGDKQHRLDTILKVTSGSTPEIASQIDAFYSSFVSAGTFKASSIQVAEAAKVIENAQRDINIAFINELAQIFERLGLDTSQVLEAAGTKWNFLNFQPGLVGGHCIGVDPYYLAYKAEAVGYQPEVILSGRKVNDGMGSFIAKQVVKSLAKQKLINDACRVLILGITFKENCPDIRNTRVVDIFSELTDFGLAVDVYDPQASREEVVEEYGIELMTSMPEWENYQGIIVAVKHSEFLHLDWAKIHKQVPVIYDAKGVIPSKLSIQRL